MKAILAVASLASIACASGSPSSPRDADLAARLPVGWRIDSPSRDLIHERSGFHFTPTRNGCTRVAPHDFDDTGENAAIGYNCSHVWLTFYVYPTSFGGTPEPMEHFKLVVSDALTARPGAEVERAVRREVPVGFRVLPGFVAYLTWRDEAGDVGSWVVLVPDGPRFVKVRTTFLRDRTDRSLREAWELTEAVLRAVASDGESGG
jgi:hypothetical protein